MVRKSLVEGACRIERRTPLKRILHNPQNVPPSELMEVDPKFAKDQVEESHFGARTDKHLDVGMLSP